MRSLIAASALLALSTFGVRADFTGPPVIPPAYPALVTGGTQIYPLYRGSRTWLQQVPPAQNVAACQPFFGPAMHIDELLLVVDIVGTGPLSAALYSDAIDGVTNRHQPQALIASGSFTVTSTGAATLALGTAGVGVAIPAGLTWACTNDANATDALRADILAPDYISSLTGTNETTFVADEGGFGLTISETSGTWPSFAGQTFADSKWAFNFAVRVVSAP